MGSHGNRTVYVRYVSPFGTSARMDRGEALRHLAEETEQYDRLADAERGGAGKMLTDQQRHIGPPRIESLPR